jgi:hypothetical protein
MKAKWALACAVLGMLVVAHRDRAQAPQLPAADDAAAMPGKESPMSFTERSPLSSRAELSKRLSEKITEEDYDLGKETFYVYVPKEADAKGKMGLVYLFNFKDTEGLPEQCFSVFDETHVIFVTTKDVSQPIWVRCGLALDLVHNLKKSLKVDEGRVYAIDGALNTSPGERCALGYPEVFTGALWVYYRPYRQVGTKGRTYRDFIPKPPAQQLEMAKQRPTALAVMTERDEYRDLAYNTFQQDGFKRLKRMTITGEQFHYPAYTTDWLKEVITFWDATRPAVVATAPPAAPKPASAPEPSPEVPAAVSAPAPAAPPSPQPPANAGPDASTAEAQRMVNLAKSYISAQRYEPARTRLNAVVENYPGTPAAKEAKQLLDQIKGK